MKWFSRNAFSLCGEGAKDEKNKQQAQHHGRMKGHEETLVKIRGAVVNLVDRENSEELAKGEFSLVRLLQGDRGVSIYAKVGEDLRWPLAKDQSAVKVDACHYLFSVRLPPTLEEAGHLAKSGGNDVDVLNFGVTFGDEDERLAWLDTLLEEHACFSLPGRSSWSSCLPNSAGEKPSGKDSKDSEAYWTDLAPKVEDYNSVLAKAIAAGSGQVIKGIFVCSDVYSSQVRKGGKAVRSRLGDKENVKESEKRKRTSEISPRVKTNIRRVRKLSKMTEKLSDIVVDGVFAPVDIVGDVASQSNSGRSCFRKVPGGDVALASLDAYNKVLEAAQVAGKNAGNTTTDVAAEIVVDRYGEDAAEVTRDTFAIAGHALGTAANVSKLGSAGII